MWFAEKIWTGLDLNCWLSERGCKRNGRWIGYGIPLIGFLIPFIVHFVSFENHFFSLLKKKGKPMHEPVGEYLLSLSPNFAMNMFRVSRKSVEKYHYEFHCANPIILLTWTVSDSSSDMNVINSLCCYDHFVIIIIKVATLNIYTLRYNNNNNNI